MYATVQDAAIVIAKATETFLTSKDGERILGSYQVSGSCPLRSMKEGETALGQRMLNEIKMVILIIEDELKIFITEVSSRFCPHPKPEMCHKVLSTLYSSSIGKQLW